jgi:hypothetical protein
MAGNIQLCLFFQEGAFGPDGEQSERIFADFMRRRTIQFLETSGAPTVPEFEDLIEENWPELMFPEHDEVED